MNRRNADVVTMPPGELARHIYALAAEIEQAKGDIQAIKDRGFWQRVMANNTKDLAELLEKQSDTMVKFLGMLRCTLGLYVLDTRSLGKLQVEFLRLAEASGRKEERYLRVVTDIISEYYQASVENDQKRGASEAKAKRLEQLLDDVIGKVRTTQALHAELKEKVADLDQKAQGISEARKKAEEALEKGQHMARQQEQLRHEVSRNADTTAAHENSIQGLSATVQSLRKDIESIAAALPQFARAYEDLHERFRAMNRRHVLNHIRAARSTRRMLIGLSAAIIVNVLALLYLFLKVYVFTA
jgi:predicted  nucleic acid-binding Zn-ribbon protein